MGGRPEPAVLVALSREGDGMNYLAIDLEMNQPSGKILEVGAVVGNLEHGVFAEKAWVVDPMEPVAEEIAELTGINDEIVAEMGVLLPTVAVELAEMIDTHQCFVNPVQWGAGDADLLKREFKLAGVHFPYFGRRTVDVKTIVSYLAVAQGKKPKGGLASYVSRYGLKFFGVPHRAAFDARNTLELFFAVLRRQRDMEDMLCLSKSLK